MKYITNQFKQGLKILIEGEPCSIISYEFHKPGKGQAVMRTKLYNLRTEKVWERTFKTGESVEAADISEKEYQYLYNEGDTFIFMDQSSFEQINVEKMCLKELNAGCKGRSLQDVVLEWRGSKNGTSNIC